MVVICIIAVLKYNTIKLKFLGKYKSKNNGLQIAGIDMSGIDLLAHYDKENNKRQFLIDHLLNTAKIASNIGKDIGIDNLCFLLGVLHDVGKADIKFQDMLKNISNSKTKVIHSTAGAYFLFEKEYDKDLSGNEHKNHKNFIEICMYVIEAHHGLFDIVGKSSVDVLQSFDYVNKIFERVGNYKNDSSYDKEAIENFIYNEVTSIVNNNSEFNSVEKLIESAFQEYSNIIKIFDKNYVPLENEKQKNKHKREERRFFDAMLIRLLLSILKAADVEDTINAYGLVVESRAKEESFSLKKHYVDAIEEEYNRYNGNDKEVKPINKVRNCIANKLLNRGQNDGAGIYRLDVPTGAGKTKASLRYALHQMADGSKNKFIYVTAFLSVLEQNAKEIKAIIGEEGVLEHHSNADIFNENSKASNEKEDMEYVQKSFMVDAWEDSAILTTMVQFFNTLFKGKSANLRRFSSLINSVIVIDEVQSLPIEVMYFFNLTMNFLKNVMKCTIVLCTATQPIYDHDSIRHKLQYGSIDKGNQNATLVELSDESRKCFDRYSVRKIKDDSSDNLKNIHVSAEEIVKFVFANQDKSILIVVNTKAAARSIVKSIDEKNLLKKNIYYLTTNLCPAHRRKIISEIKERLSRGEKIICVSTQLIEAGVDVDFEIVMRSYAGVDSIIQVAGRCNREGKLSDGGEVILFNLDEATENTKKILGIADKKKITKDILAQMHEEIQVDDLVENFYGCYFSNEADGGNRMKYPLEKDQSSLFDLFVGNGIKKGDIKNENGKLRGKLKEVAEKFQLISDDTNDIFVFYEGGIADLNKLLSIAEKELISAGDWVEVKRLIRELQPYSINIYKNDKLNEFVDSYLDGNIKVLQQDHYDKRLGANEEIGTFII